MYHAIGDPAARFIVPLAAAVRALASGAAPPPKAIAITFDDGARDLSTVACPVLVRRRRGARVS